MMPRREVAEGDTFSFDRPKEGFHNGIIVAITSMAQAEANILLSQQNSIVRAGILAIAIKLCPTRPHSLMAIAFACSTSHFSVIHWLETVKRYVKYILHKLSAHNGTEAIAKARARSLID